jgi:hypothetical protein
MRTARRAGPNEWIERVNVWDIRKIKRVDGGIKDLPRGIVCRVLFKDLTPVVQAVEDFEEIYAILVKDFGEKVMPLIAEVIFDSILDLAEGLD